MSLSRRVVFRFFRTIPKTLNRLALAALGVLFFKVFLFNQIPELFRGAYELGVVLDGLLASVFASYVFYLIVVHGKDFHDQSIISPHIAKWTSMIVGDCKSQLKTFAQAADVELSFDTVSQDSARSAFSKLDPYSDAPLSLGLNKRANWLQYMDYYRVRTKGRIVKIFAQLRFLDAQLVALLTAVDDCSHFDALRHLSAAPITNPDMSAFSGAFYKYCVACRNLDTYLNSIKSQ